MRVGSPWVGCIHLRVDAAVRGRFGAGRRRIEVAIDVLGILGLQQRVARGTGRRQIADPETAVVGGGGLTLCQSQIAFDVVAVEIQARQGQLEAGDAGIHAILDAAIGGGAVTVVEHRARDGGAHNGDDDVVLVVCRIRVDLAGRHLGGVGRHAARRIGDPAHRHQNAGMAIHGHIAQHAGDDIAHQRAGAAAVRLCGGLAGDGTTGLFPGDGIGAAHDLESRGQGVLHLGPGDHDAPEGARQRMARAIVDDLHHVPEFLAQAERAGIGRQRNTRDARRLQLMRGLDDRQVHAGTD
ncbi:hypothetical protein D3C81_547260 [compost metagenome]